MREMLRSLSSPPSSLVLAEAWWLIARCMSRNGLRFLPWELWSARQPSVALRLGGLGALLRVDVARRSGYGSLIERVREDGVDDPDVAQEDYLATLPEDDYNRFYELLDPSDSPQPRLKLESGAVVSTATTGCAAEARKRIYGSVAGFLKAQNFFNELTGHGDEVREDQRVKDAVAEYSNCMGDAGYDVVDTSDARYQTDEAFGRSRRLSDPVSEAERAMAVADAECQESSGINTAMEDSFVDVMSVWLNDHEADIVALHDEMNIAIEQAEAVIAHLPRLGG
jgi:hypothetical protein